MPSSPLRRLVLLALWTAALWTAALSTVGVSTAVASLQPAELTLTVTPASAQRGDSLELAGSGWDPAAAGQPLPVTWAGVATRRAEVIGTATVNDAGVLTGSATLPLTAAVGPGTVVVCWTPPAGVAVGCARAPVTVSPPTVQVEPATLAAGADAALTGRGWCCDGDGARVVDAGSGHPWGSATVDAAGRLSGTVTVPAGTADGTSTLRLCVRADCAETALAVSAAGSGGTSTGTTPGTGSPTGSPTDGTPTTDSPTAGTPGPGPGSTPGWVPVAAGTAVLATLLGGVGLALPRMLRRRRAGSAGPAGRSNPSGREGRSQAPPTGTPFPAVPVWPTITLPAEVVAGEPVEARIDLRPRGGAPLDGFSVDLHLTADHYAAPAGTRFAGLAVAGGGTAALTFPLVPEQVAAPMVARVVAYLSWRGQLVGWTQAAPTVLPAGWTPQPGTAPTASVPLGRPDGPAPDLTVTVTRGDDPRYLLWGLVSPHPIALPAGEVRCDLDADDARAFAHDEVLALADTEQELFGLHLRGVSAEIGGRVPAPVWTALREVSRHALPAGHPPVVLLVSEETHVPWELAAVPPDLRPDPAAPALLGAQTWLGRWLPPDAGDGLTPQFPRLPPSSTTRLDAFAVVVHEIAGAAAPALPHAREEAERLQAGYGAVVVPATTADVAALLEMSGPDAGGWPAPDVLHVACHGRIDPEHPARSGLLLSAGWDRWAPLTPAMLRGSPLLAGSQPFVFLNACESGTPQEALDRFGGLVSAALKGGARAVVAPLWRVGDLPARDVALGVYAACLERGLPLGQALAQVRAAATRPDGAGFERGHLAYVFYGNPWLRLARPTPAG